MEFALELLPAFSTGLRIVTDHFGIDPLEATRNAYYQAYLREHRTRGMRTSCNRKVCNEQHWTDEISGRGFVNVWPEFVHISLLFINPPSGMSRDMADKFLQNKLAKLLEEFGLLNADSLKLRFSGKVRKALLGGERCVWQVDSDPSPWIRYLQQHLLKTFQDNGWEARLPMQLDKGNGRVHLTIRDDRYPSQVKGMAPPSSSDFQVEIEKFAVTPAAQNDCRHHHRQHCGATLVRDFRLRSNFHGRSTPTPLLLSDLSAFPSLASQRNKCLPKPKRELPVTEPVFHEDRAAEVDDTSAAAIAGVLFLSTLNKHGSDHDVPLGELGWTCECGAQNADIYVTCQQCCASMSLVQGPEKPEREGDVEGGLSSAMGRVHMLHFSFKGMKADEFVSTLSDCKELQKFLEITRKDRAKIIVYPGQREAVSKALETKTLRPFHVVITSSLEPLLWKSMEHLSSKNRPRAKQKKVLLDVAASENMDCQQRLSPKFEVKRTFLCEVVVLRASRSVVQSTTEATTSAINPRRVVGGLK